MTGRLRLAVLATACAVLLPSALHAQIPGTGQEGELTDRPRWLEVEFTEEFHIGDDPTEHQFARVSEMAFAPDGRLVVVDAEDFGVTVYDRGGDQIGRWGSQGEGPGEFPFRPGSMAVSDEGTIAIYSSTRVNLYTLAGDAIDSRIVRPLRIENLVFGAGNALLALGSRGRLREDNPREFVRLDDGEALWSSPPMPSITGGGPLSLWEPGPVVAQLWDDEIAVAMSDSYDIRILDASTGRTVGRIARDVPLRGPSDEFMENLREEMIEISGEDSPLVQRLAGAHPFPVVTKVLTGPPGRTIWVGRGTGIGDALAAPVAESMDDWDYWQYDLFDADTHRYLGSVETPEGLILKAGDANRIAGFQRGPFDVPSVRVLRVVVKTP